VSCVAHEGDGLPAKITGEERTLAVILGVYRPNKGSGETIRKAPSYL